MIKFTIFYVQSYALWIPPLIVKELDNFSIIIDTSSLASIFRNKKLVKDVISTKKALKLIINGRSIRFKTIGTFKGIKV